MSRDRRGRQARCRPWIAIGVAAALLLGAGCGAPGREREASPRKALPHARELSDIAAREAARDADPGLFEMLLGHGAAPVRSAAARALGRIGEGASLELLEARARDGNEDPRVVGEAIFALGQLGDPRALPVLARLLEHDNPWLRARAAEAIGKLKGEGLEGDPVALLTAALDDPEPAVRGSAALAIWHHGEGARPAVPVLAAHLAPGEDPDVRWKAAYALMRIDDPGTHEPLRGALADDHAWVQTFAAWGLRNPPDPQGVGPLGALLSDPESSWTARAQALWTLKKLRQEGIGDPKAIRDLLLLHLLREKHPLASEALIEALAAGAGEIELPFLVATLEHPRSVTVRRATIRAAAGVLLKEGHPLIEAFARHDDPLTRAALAAGLAECGEEALPFIARLLEDGDRRVRSAAVGSLGRLEVEERWQLIRRVSADPDLAVRTTAIDAIAEAKPSGWVADLVAAFEASGAPDLWELRALILEALKEEREAVEPLARRALGDPFPSLRRRAAEILGEEDPAAVEAGGPADPGPYPLLTAADLRGEGNPRLILETARGDMVLELYLADAPRHVSNIVHLARSGFYDGLTFHRVVPSFVVQGGDPRADGWGDAGYHLVDEINPRPYLRGSLGMPKAGNDTGGCQIFITHLPTPHLDGRYTVFGRVVEGLPVIDRLEVGDRIVRARVDESRLRPRGP